MRVVALAIEQQVTLLTDDNGVRMLAMAYHVPVIGSIGILIRARLDGVIPTLKPLEGVAELWICYSLVEEETHQAE
jgi:predicted nucleic acid-binding protein